MKTNINPTSSDAPAVVATVHSRKGLRAASRLRPSCGIGFIEVRADGFEGDLSSFAKGVSSINLPVLLTVRHPAEGGEGHLSLAARRAQFAALMDHAAAIDVELRSLPAMVDILREARGRGQLAVVSCHHFRRTPALEDLRGLVQRGFAGGADIVKVATWLRGPRDLAVLLQLQVATARPLATMGMGPLGKVSRLALAAAGSRLNYGYLDKPRVEGQWPALRLAALLREVAP